MAKYVFVTGGVTSSLGKGITAASIGRLLKSRGLSVSILNPHPYINVDPGTSSPYQAAFRSNTRAVIMTGQPPSTSPTR